MGLGHCNSIQDMRIKDGDEAALNDLNDTLYAFHEAKEQKLLNAYLSEIERCHPNLYKKIPYVKNVLNKELLLNY